MGDRRGALFGDPGLLSSPLITSLTGVGADMQRWRRRRCMDGYCAPFGEGSISDDEWRAAALDGDLSPPI